IAQLDHPNLITIYEVGEWAGAAVGAPVPFLAMEFLSGGSLEERLAGQHQPPHQAAALIATLARALHAVHQRGIIHRDLKPANILLDHAGQPRITDFGLAKRMTGDSGLTHTGAILGTPAYMPPEQAAGQAHALGPSADLYALGAILYQLLTGQPPFRGD